MRSRTVLRQSATTRDGGARAIGLAAAACLALSLAGAASASAAGDPLRGEQWNLDAVHADEAHRISIGTGVTVAVVDSGVDATHPDLVGNVVNGPDFIDGDQIPADENGHGTNVAGIIVDHAGNGIGTAGAAPGAKVLAIRALDASKRGTTDQEAQGIDAAVAAGAQVINLSLNAGPNIVAQLLPSDRLVQSIGRAAQAGVVIVASAGNDNAPLCAQPLLAVRILCVGATNRATQRASYSNYSIRVDIVAPGGELTAGNGIAAARAGGGYSAEAGTSQATPHVAAAAALLVSLGLRGQQVVDRLENTARDLGNALLYGHGLLDMGAAVAGLGPELPVAAAAPSALEAEVGARQDIARVGAHGVRVRCRAPAAGPCAVRVTARHTLLARGSRDVAANVTSTVRARLTRAGRRLLVRSDRLSASVRITAPGAVAVRKRIRFAR